VSEEFDQLPQHRGSSTSAGGRRLGGNATDRMVGPGRWQARVRAVGQCHDPMKLSGHLTAPNDLQVTSEAGVWGVGHPYQRRDFTMRICSL